MQLLGGVTKHPASRTPERQDLGLGPLKGHCFWCAKIDPSTCGKCFCSYLDSCITAWSLFMRRLKTSSLVICAKTGCSMTQWTGDAAGCSLSKIATRCVLTAHWQDSGVFHQAARHQMPSLASDSRWGCGVGTAHQQSQTWDHEHE